MDPDRPIAVCLLAFDVISTCVPQAEGSADGLKRRPGRNAKTGDEVGGSCARVGIDCFVLLLRGVGGDTSPPLAYFLRRPSANPVRAPRTAFPQD